MMLMHEIPAFELRMERVCKILAFFNETKVGARTSPASQRSGFEFLDLTGYFATLISKLSMPLITCISAGVSIPLLRLFTAISIRISFLDTFLFYTHAEGQN